MANADRKGKPKNRAWGNRDHRRFLLSALPFKGGAQARNKVQCRRYISTKNNQLKTVTITNKVGIQKTVRFPIDEGMYKAIKSLSKEEQLKYFTEEYREWKKERNYQRNIASSLDVKDSLYNFVHDIPDEGPNPAEVYEAKERQHAVDKAITSLIPSQQVVIRMKYEEDLTPGEIAERLGISLSAVSHRLQRAEDILRAMLNDYQ